MYNLNAPEQLVSLPKQLVSATEQLQKCFGAVIRCSGAVSVLEQLVCLPEQLVSATEQLQKCSGAVSKYFEAVSKCYGAVAKVFPSSYESNLGIPTNCKSRTVIGGANRHMLTLTVMLSVRCVPNTHNLMTSQPSRAPNCNCNSKCGFSKCL